MCVCVCELERYIKTHFLDSSCRTLSGESFISVAPPTLALEVLNTGPFNFKYFIWLECLGAGRSTRSYNFRMMHELVSVGDLLPNASERTISISIETSTLDCLG